MTLNCKTEHNCTKQGSCFNIWFKFRLKVSRVADNITSVGKLFLIFIVQP